METSELLKKVRKIEIKAKGKSMDLFSGAYHSAFKGRGMSFSEVRAYQYGDDIRNIDWNVTAKTGEAFVKIFEEERELTIMLLIDVSPSLNFGSQNLKKDFIAEMAAVIAFNALNNHDKVGAILFSDKIEKYIPPKKGKSNVLQIIREILNIETSENKTDIKSAMDFFNTVQKKRAITFVFSDFIADNYDDSFKLLRKRHDIIPVKVNDEYDVVLPDLGLVQFYDKESGNFKVVDTSSGELRNRLKNNFEKYNKIFTTLMKKSGTDFIDIKTNEDYIKSFLKFFAKR